MIAMADYDSPWKDLIEAYFDRFMAFFFPAARDDIDWSKPPEFLNTEFQQIVRDSELGRRLADHLVKVWRKNGQELWVLVHVEVQGQKDAGFAERMYVYNYRIYDRYRKQVVSLAILADASKTWKPTEFGYRVWGCEIGIRFPVVKLLDYEKEGEIPLEQQHNPFAIATKAHILAKRSKGKSQERLAWKLGLIKGLYQGGYTRQEILDLFRFIDWIMTLPEKEEKLFKEDLIRFEEGLRMQYVTSIERLGKKEGKKEGRLEFAREALQDILRIRFKRVPKPLGVMIQSIDQIAILKSLHKSAITYQNIEDIESELKRLLNMGQV